MKCIVLLALAGMVPFAAADDLVIGPADGPASSYPFCGS